MTKDKIKVSSIIDREELINKAFELSKTPDEFKELRLIIEDTDELTCDVTQIEDEEERKISNEALAMLALDTLLHKYNQTKVAMRIDAEDTRKKEEKEEAKRAFEKLKKILGEDNPLVSTLGEIFNSEEE